MWDLDFQNYLQIELSYVPPLVYWKALSVNFGELKFSKCPLWKYGNDLSVHLGELELELVGLVGSSQE